jgi:hypothetical protein
MWKAVIVYPNGIQQVVTTDNRGGKLDFDTIQQNRSTGLIEGLVLAVYDNLKHKANRHAKVRLTQR